MLELYVPLVLWQLAIAWWLQRFNVDPVNERGLLVQGGIVTLAVIPIYLIAFLRTPS